MRYLVNQHTGELEGLPSIPIASSEEKDMFLKGDGTYAEVDLDAFTGATGQNDGGRGTVPAPLAGDQDKVLQGNGSWGKKLQFDVVIQNGVYGYINGLNVFVPFKSQADIDAAVTAAKVGTATAADVLSGKTFTNSTDSGLAGSMENLSTNNRYQHASNNGTPTILGDAGFFTTVYDKVAGTNLGDYFEIRYNGSPNKNASNNDTANGYIRTNTLLALPSQTKTVTPTTSAQTVSPDSNKVLKSVTVSAISTQEKTVTGSRSAQTVTPDSGKYLSKVTVNKYPDATGTYTTTTRGTAVDMGATNNYRYVNTNGVTNTNSGTYTMGTASTGATYDMGSTNTYRYVNAANVYSKGKTDGHKFSGIYSIYTNRNISSTNYVYTLISSHMSTSYVAYILVFISNYDHSVATTFSNCVKIRNKTASSGNAAGKLSVTVIYTSNPTVNQTATFTISSSPTDLAQSLHVFGVKA